MIEDYSSSKFQPDTPSVRDKEPSRSKRCDGKSISLRKGAMQRDTRPGRRPAACTVACSATCFAAVNSRHTVHNADSAFFSQEIVESSFVEIYCNTNASVVCEIEVIYLLT